MILLSRRLLPVGRGGPRQSLDPGGVVLFAAAMLFVLLPLVEGNQRGSLAQRPWWLLGVAAVLLLAFVLWERLWLARGRETLVDLSLARVRSYAFGLGVGTVYFAGFTSIFLVMTLYLQVGLGYSALEAGLTQMPFAIGSAVSAWLGGRWVTRYGRALVVVGLVLVVVGLLALDLLVPQLSSAIGLKLAPAFLVAGFGGGLVIAPNVTLTLAAVDPVRAGSAGGMLQTAQRVGGAIGVAVVLAQFFERLAARPRDFADALSVSLRTTVGFVVVALVIALVDLLWPGRAATSSRGALADPAHPPVAPVHETAFLRGRGAARAHGSGPAVSRPATLVAPWTGRTSVTRLAPSPGIVTSWPCGTRFGGRVWPRQRPVVRRQRAGIRTRHVQVISRRCVAFPPVLRSRGCRPQGGLRESPSGRLTTVRTPVASPSFRTAGSGNLRLTKRDSGPIRVHCARGAVNLLTEAIHRPPG